MIPKSPLRRLRVTAVWVAIWTALALLFCTSDYLQQTIALDRQVSWWGELPSYLLMFGAWGALTPAMVWLVRRFPVDAPHRARNLLVQVAAVPVAVVSHTLLLTAAAYATGRVSPDVEVGPLIGRQLLVAFLLGTTTYASVVVVLHTFHYQRALREREVAQSRLQAQLAQARLTALRAQLNPHFLFNTLHSVSALMGRDVPGARQMLARLSDLLRLALEGGMEQECALREEMEFVDHYLAIQQIRFRDRLQVSRDVAPETLEARIPRLLLQPLVENAIQHALEPRNVCTRVHIAAARHGGNVRLTVRDDGQGLRADGVEERIGLGNTRARVEGLYGTAGALRVRTLDGGGTAVEITLPYREGAHG
ncbi:MAG TPA: histidine kinase [Longimicrobium sp.]|nr:histidine kinase [Longimicrobium sp.]